MERLQVRHSQAPTKKRLMSTLLNYMPGAWVSPSPDDLVTLYRQRYRMALDERKYDIAMIFLNKILEVDPLNLGAKFCKGEIYHRHLNDYSRAVEQYNKVIRLSGDRSGEDLNLRARNSLTEIMELLS